MAATLNLHKLFAGRDGYLDNLRVEMSEAIVLQKAREEIRQTLRDAFRDWESYVRRTEMFDSLVLKAATNVQLAAPKFRIQGSFAYHTANDCQQTPPQQIDQDDGVFLPMSFLTNGGTTKPGIASRAYFSLVEQALAPLCQARGWSLNPGGEKNTCVRVEINPRLHIDLPLYAIRDEAFNSLVESALASMQKSFDAMDAAVGTELRDEIYYGLEAAEILVAHRTKGWLESDPRKLEDWFRNAINLYGDQVRRVSRAYKGLRDAKWTEGGPSSICLMAGVVGAYERLNDQDPNRDDLALMYVAREMAQIFQDPVENPALPGISDKCLCAEWTPEFRALVCKTFSDVADQLEAAIHDTLNRQIALNRAKVAFGPRIPDDFELISTLGAVQVIRQTPPEPQPRPMPPRTKSG
ncbi:CBASS cGAMP synthase [Phenylobacterium sp.]|uniref:CBASS cGAMP synthase n=1 Tax=Phenylobacterium sp. TaxID=1871053 RepID=UPI003BA99EC2